MKYSSILINFGWKSIFLDMRMATPELASCVHSLGKSFSSSYSEIMPIFDVEVFLECSKKMDPVCSCLLIVYVFLLGNCCLLGSSLMLRDIKNQWSLIPAFNVVG